MWCTHGARAEHIPFRIEPEFGQVAEYPPEGFWVSKECWDVLHDDVSRLYCANDVGEPGPAPTLVSRATLQTRDRERLAGESPADDVNWWSGNSVPPRSGSSDVVMAGNLRVVLGEYGAGCRVQFDLADYVHAGAF